MRLTHPLLVLIANAAESELAKDVEYLKVENQILRDRLPKKIETTEAERNRLLEGGQAARRQGEPTDKYCHAAYVSALAAGYHIHRPHRGLDYRTPKQVETGKETDTVESLSSTERVLRESLGGALKWYERKAV